MSTSSSPWQLVVRTLEWFTILLFTALVFDVIWGVVSRYVPGIVPSDWTEELAVYLLIWVSLFGGALTYREYGHLGVDYFVGKLDPAAQRGAAIVVEISVLVFAGFALVFGGSRLVAETLAANQLTPVLQWKIGYLYSAVPVSGLFMCAFALEHLLNPPRVTPPSPKEA